MGGRRARGKERNMNRGSMDVDNGREGLTVGGQGRVEKW